MNKLILGLFSILLVGLLVVGCGEKTADPMSNGNLVELANFMLPPGATLESATFYINVVSASGQTINVHRITSSWDEPNVSWNNFAGAYTPDIYGSFVADAVGWHSVDLKSLVQEWLSGTYDNYGFLIEQENITSLRTDYNSRESISGKPYMEICYTVGGVTSCETIDPLGDAYINELYPDGKHGLLDILYTGWSGITDYEKQSLLMFEFTPSEPELCALGDTVWYDDDKDGIQEAGEAGVEGVTVHLYNCAGELLATTVTDASGFYIFEDLNPGDYQVMFDNLPEGYVFTMQDQGTDDALDSDADPVTGMTICTNLVAGERDMTWDAGIYLMEFDGCSLTIGFWKTHAGFGPQDDVVTQYLPIWLGTPGGAKSMQVTTAQMAVNILSQYFYCDPSNGITKLYAQMLGSKLNEANGADISVISGYFDAADEFLATHNCDDWDSLSKNDQKKVNFWKSKFDDYNNGDIGPGHCGD